jgi:hypothetical protein
VDSKAKKKQIEKVERGMAMAQIGRNKKGSYRSCCGTKKGGTGETKKKTFQTFCDINC